MNVPTQDAFAAIRSKRATDDGKACVDIAEKIYGSADDDASKEARQWIALALACDKAAADGDIAALKEKAAAKARTDELAERMKQVANGNVVPMPPRKDSV